LRHASIFHLTLEPDRVSADLGGVVRSVATVLVLAAMLAALVVDPAYGTPGSPAGGGSGEVAIFYYPWYGTDIRDGSWEHWSQNGNTPPLEIASDWFPARGPYSSSDPFVVRSQMREIAAIGVQTVIVSWWGEGSVEAARLPLVAKAARAAGLRVAVHVEPFPGRTPASLAPSLRALAAKGITDAYVYDSTSSPDAEWRALNVQLPGMRLFANTSLPGKAQAGGFAGLYTYDVRIYDGSSFPRVCASARMRGLVCAPSVGPGFDALRATGDTRVKSRKNGAAYDWMWRGAIKAAADIVTITSYNEWHEGTQIEAASAVGPPYASYDGAYGLAGRAAQRAYLDRTAMWADRYRQYVGRFQ
jgi:glycoprotein endo-alpha-1,2-mannosidase